jgi:hypothetical protein
MEGDESEDGGDNAGVTKTYRKANIASDLRRYLDTPGCLRLVVDDVFDNPPPPSTGRKLSVPCCHNCILASCDSPPDTLRGLIDLIHARTPLNRTLLEPIHDIDDLLQPEQINSTLVADVDAIVTNAQKRTRKANGEGD